MQRPKSLPKNSSSQEPDLKNVLKSELFHKDESKNFQFNGLVNQNISDIGQKGEQILLKKQMTYQLSPHQQNFSNQLRTSPSFRNERNQVQAEVAQYKNTTYTKHIAYQESSNIQNIQQQKGTYPVGKLTLDDSIQEIKLIQQQLDQFNAKMQKFEETFNKKINEQNQKLQHFFDQQNKNNPQIATAQSAQMKGNAQMKEYVKQFTKRLDDIEGKLRKLKSIDHKQVSEEGTKALETKNQQQKNLQITQKYCTIELGKNIKQERDSSKQKHLQQLSPQHSFIEKLNKSFESKQSFDAYLQEMINEIILKFMTQNRNEYQQRQNENKEQEQQQVNVRLNNFERTIEQYFQRMDSEFKTSQLQQQQNMVCFNSSKINLIKEIESLKLDYLKIEQKLKQKQTYCPTLILQQNQDQLQTEINTINQQILQIQKNITEQNDINMNNLSQLRNQVEEDNKLQKYENKRYFKQIYFPIKLTEVDQIEPEQQQNQSQIFVQETHTQQQGKNIIQINENEQQDVVNNFIEIEQQSLETKIKIEGKIQTIQK